MTAIRLTIPELLDQHPTEVMALSPQQRSFTLEYIAGFFAQGKYDARAAVKVAYPNITEERNISIWANRILHNKRVAHIIGLHQGLSELDMLFADLQCAVKKGLRKNRQKATVVTPDVARALLLFESYVTQKESR